MITIESEDLKKLLESNKGIIERPLFTGIGEIVSGISLILTLGTSHFENIPFFRTSFFYCLMFFVAIVIIFTGGYSLFVSCKSRQSVGRLFSSIQELDVNHIHVVNIVLFKNSPQDGKYLLKKNKAWKCDLFPSYNTQSSTYDIEKEKVRISNSFSKDIGIDNLSIDYLGALEKHIKICAGENTPYRYEFHFYRVDFVQSDERLNKGFSYNGNKYVWKSLDGMLKNKNIMKKNSDVVQFVAEIETIPYN